MGTYPPGTVRRKSGANGWYVCVTIPKELRPFFPGAKTQLLRKIKGATSRADAYDMRKPFEAEIYLELDRVNVARHPLCVAASKLDQVLTNTGGGQSTTYNFNKSVISIWIKI